MRNYIKLPLSDAIDKGLIKDGDKIFAEVEISKIYRYEHVEDAYPVLLSNNSWMHKNDLIAIKKPHRKSNIDFSIPDQIVKFEDTVLKTTGFASGEYFSAVVVSHPEFEAGYADNCWNIYYSWELRESDTRIDYLDISVRALNILRYNQISTLEELSKMTPSDFMKLRNMGKKTFVEMTEVLSHHGLSWKS